MPSDIHLLRTNATLSNPTTEDRSSYTISVEHPEWHCKITIAALKPFPLALQRDPRQPNYIPVDPNDWVQITHGEDKCPCAADNAKEVFRRWQELHLVLRYKASDNAAHPFYPDFEYEDGENLGHASLIASLTLGLRVPDCYCPLYVQYGPEQLAKLFKKHEIVEWDQAAGRFVASAPEVVIQEPEEEDEFSEDEY
ncbi:hypothetical protein F5Y18DRAFT_412140 [Xylariaceae sp. FL1019]|nr:hypothetical protein F5Y18DRAFT_412140 [Xylariaceae sp. FL1019]